MLHSALIGLEREMKYSAFEQAAAEASSGVNEIDAEINRLMAKRDVLEKLVHQLLAVLPGSTEANPAADGGSEAGAIPDDRAARQPSFADGAAERESYSSEEEGPAHYAAGTAPEPDAPQTEQPSYADLMSQGKPYSLRNEGWPASSAVDQRGLRRLL
jgi:hypothetical protein